MKFVIRLWMVLSAALLAACAGATSPQKAVNQEPPLGTPNPASVFCVQQGGKSVIRKDEGGNEYGVCVFPDGKEVYEWALFRRYHE